MASGDGLSQDDIDRRIAVTTRVADSAAVTTVETVVDTVVAFLVAGRTYEVAYDCGFNSSIANDSMLVRIREDSVSGTQMQVGRGTSLASNGAGSKWPLRVAAEYTPAVTGNKTFVSTLIRVVGSGNCNIQAGSTYPTTLSVTYVRN